MLFLFFSLSFSSVPSFLSSSSSSLSCSSSFVFVVVSLGTSFSSPGSTLKYPKAEKNLVGTRIYHFSSGRFNLPLLFLYLFNCLFGFHVGIVFSSVLFCLFFFCSFSSGAAPSLLFLLHCSFLCLFFCVCVCHVLCCSIFLFVLMVFLLFFS